MKPIYSYNIYNNFVSQINDIIIFSTAEGSINATDNSNFEKPSTYKIPTPVIDSDENKSYKLATTTTHILANTYVTNQLYITTFTQIRDYIDCNRNNKTPPNELWTPLDIKHIPELNGEIISIIGSYYDKDFYMMTNNCKIFIYKPYETLSNQWLNITVDTQFISSDNVFKYDKNCNNLFITFIDKEEDDTKTILAQQFDANYSNMQVKLIKNKFDKLAKLDFHFNRKSNILVIIEKQNIKYTKFDDFIEKDDEKIWTELKLPLKTGELITGCFVGVNEVYIATSRTIYYAAVTDDGILGKWKIAIINKHQNQEHNSKLRFNVTELQTYEDEKIYKTLDSDITEFWTFVGCNSFPKTEKSLMIAVTIDGRIFYELETGSKEKQFILLDTGVNYIVNRFTLESILDTILFDNKYKIEMCNFVEEMDRVSKQIFEMLKLRARTAEELKVIEALEKMRQEALNQTTN